MALKFLERLGLIEKKSDLLACKRFDPEEVLQALNHSLPLTAEAGFYHAQGLILRPRQDSQHLRFCRASQPKNRSKGNES
jgi:hypothetical protein